MGSILERYAEPVPPRFELDVAWRWMLRLPFETVAAVVGDNYQIQLMHVYVHLLSPLSGDPPSLPF
jgi:hypothetical protein